jgi:hypothetical protein
MPHHSFATRTFYPVANILVSHSELNHRTLHRTIAELKASEHAALEAMRRTSASNAHGTLERLGVNTGGWGQQQQQHARKAVTQGLHRAWIMRESEPRLEREAHVNTGVQFERRVVGDNGVEIGEQNPSMPYGAKRQMIVHHRERATARPPSHLGKLDKLGVNTGKVERVCWVCVFCFVNDRMMFLSMYVCTCVFLCVCVYTCVFMYIHAVCSCMYVRIHVCMYACMMWSRACSTYVCVCVCIHTHTHMYNIRVCICCMFNIRVYICVHTHITFIYTRHTPSHAPLFHSTRCIFDKCMYTVCTYVHT